MDRSLDRSRIRIIFAGLMMVLLLAALDQTIVATALPTIVGDLGGLNKLAWVTSAFLLAQTAVTPIYGKLGDLYGRKRVLQSAIVIFLIGSALCGQAGNMTELIAFRAIQGLGAGGLVVLTQAVVGDIVSPRERGRYQGLFGAVFGVASIAGPLLGGVLVDAVSWRWIFYVNLPIGIAALAVISVALPAQTPTGKAAVDYVGAALLAAGVSAIVLVTSLGGTTWAWSSPQVVVVAALGVALILLFAYYERRAADPILPPRLTRDRVFAVASSLSAIVGFAMFGSVTFLPLYFQTVDGASPTGAGLRLLPMMLGMLTMSIASGQTIARTGHYRPFPIVGTAVMSGGLALLSRLTVGTSTATSALYMLVLGIGLGLTMQVLVLAVQNAVDYKLLGAATSGVTLMRGIGGSLGAATFGTIFNARLKSQLTHALTGPLGHQVVSGGRLTGAQVARLTPAARAGYQHAYVHALSPVFEMAAGVAAVGFVLAWLLPERELRDTAATSTGLDDGLAAPRSPDSLAELERALARAVPRTQRREFRRQVAESAGLELSPEVTWALVRIDEHGVDGARRLAADQGVPDERIAAVVAELRNRGLLDGGDGTAALTPTGRDLAVRAVAARRRLLSEALADEHADRDPAVNELLRRLSRELAGERPA